MLTVEAGLSHTPVRIFPEDFSQDEICHSVKHSVSCSCLEVTSQKAVTLVVHIQTHRRTQILE